MDNRAMSEMDGLVQSEDSKVKVIVAVHGIGDQTKFETSQATLFQFCRFFNVLAGVPVGFYHSPQVAADGSLALPKPLFSGELVNYRFAEAYWANIPRIPETEGHTLEESKKWAKTIAERMALRRAPGRAPTARERREHSTARTVLEEMIEGLAVIENLLFIAKRAGILDFKLNPLLVNYLGDVQIVTEFAQYRDEIVEQFFQTMSKIHDSSPQDPEIHIVAHSEGTVIALLALLKAYSSNPMPHWAERVKGLMTIGSPLDKHRLLWPELWTPFEKHHRSGDQITRVPRADARIKWRNYFDNGDPIAFDLGDVRKWMKQNGWNTVFQFEDAHDMGFSRYYFPGKAHLDYWQDDEVFDHFIQEVVRQTSPPPNGFCKPPGNRLSAVLTSYTIPYLIIFALLYVGVYVLYKAVGDATNFGPSHVFSDTLGIASLLAGMTVMARIPRLARGWKWRFISAAIFVAGAATFRGLVDGDTIARMAEPFLRIPGATRLAFGHGVAILTSVAALISVLAALASNCFRRWGVKPLILLAGLTIAGMVAFLMRPSGPEGPLWPLILAGGGFIYLWWLAELVFDLVFIWQRFVRHSVIIRRLEEYRDSCRGPEKNAPAAFAVGDSHQPAEAPGEPETVG